jgi:VanZ family protein
LSFLQGQTSLIIAENISLKGTKTSLVYAIFWLIISTVLLTLPGSAFPKENWLDKIWFDKWVHIGMFFIMVVLWCWSVFELLGRHKKLLEFFILVTIVFTGYGIAMEFVQQNFIRNRSFDRGDIIADTIGCVAGLLFSRWRYIKRRI